MDTQPEVQAHLEAVRRRDGLEAALEALFELSLRLGYITREKLEGSERHAFRDEALGVTFRLQVNFARSGYTPLPLNPPGLPPVHCAICRENVGRPGKESLRVYEMVLNSRPFFLQLTPFPMFPLHFVLIQTEAQPQRIDRRTVQDMLAFRRLAPRYTVCSNSDVEWAGSSILEHLHYQTVRDLSLPVMEARPAEGFTAALAGCRLDSLEYPLAALRVSGRSGRRLEEAVGSIIETWKGADPGRNTVNLILSGGNEPAFTVFLRNPDFRTPAELHRIKSEGVGVIEAGGEAVLPVPSGPDSGELWRRIRTDGLRVIEGLLAGNNPVRDRQTIRRLYREVGAK